MLSDHGLLEKAIEIAKEYARSGNNTPSVEAVLERVYETLKKLNKQV